MRGRRSLAIRRALVLGALALSIATAPAAATSERGTIHTVFAGESLTAIAVQAYGDGLAWPAIMLATNSRLSEFDELDFIGDSNALEPGQKVWVPEAGEKDRWIRLYRTYVAAVLDMSLPQPWEVSRRLVALPDKSPVTVVTWGRKGQFSLGESTAGRSIWVTAAPHLRDFCRALTDRERLVERLEQRLGLPPASNKAEFAEIQVRSPERDLFRPCADPRIDTTTCPLGPPAESVSESYTDWFLRQYYSSYAQAHPTRYPWTSLGYTYDWGDSASEEGESEFVIRPEAEIEVLSITPTEDYCRPPTL